MRALQRGADVGAEQRLRIAVDPVEIERDRVEIASSDTTGSATRRRSRRGRRDRCPSGLCCRKLRISSVAREKRDGLMSCARIDAERSSMMIRSCALELRHPLGEQRLRTHEREHERAGGERAPTARTPASRCHVERRDRRAKRGGDRRALAPRRARSAGGRAQQATSTGSSCHQQRESRTEEAHARRPSPTRLAGFARRRAAGAAAASAASGGVFGCLRRSAASRVVSSKSYLVSQSSGAASTALCSSSSARRQPAEPRVGLLLDAWLSRRRRSPRPEVRSAPIRATRSALLDRLVEAPEAIERRQMVGDRVVVVGGEQLPGRRDRVEPRLGGARSWRSR